MMMVFVKFSDVYFDLRSLRVVQWLEHGASNTNVMGSITGIAHVYSSIMQCFATNVSRFGLKRLPNA